MNIFFNTHHAPIGAFATLTLGFPGARGGLGIELGRPADGNVYLGLETPTGGRFEALPFFAGANDEARRYAIGDEGTAPAGSVQAFERATISRSLRAASDTWQAGDLTVRIVSPVLPLPDPAHADAETLRDALLPAVFIELTVDNRAHNKARRAFVGYSGSEPTSAMRRLADTSAGELIGVGQGRSTAIVACAPGATAAIGFDAERALDDSYPINQAMGLGGSGMVIVSAPAGSVSTFRFAVCFHRAGLVTAGQDTSYFYTRFFPAIEDVARYASEHAERLIAFWQQGDSLLDAPHLSDDQRLMLAHAVRGYYASTQLLDGSAGPLWVVNEGEYRMINTFDLAADQIFYELKLHPWAVRNILDQYAERYAYHDTVRLPGDAREYPGGIAFTHDMGVANVFSRPGHSSYEQAGLEGCFSYMSAEQLANWVCCGALYAQATGDNDWARARLPLFAECLSSLCQRDHPDAALRDGVMDADGSRCAGGAEITTYDSLDASLGQSRRNSYLALKSWAAYVLLERLFQQHDRNDLAALAAEQADRAATTLLRYIGADGGLPAILDDAGAGRIIPAIEGLIFPYAAGYFDVLDPAGRYGALIGALRRHLEAVLTPGVCLFNDGGWKLSASNTNSWLSKIYLCQFVARAILGVDGPQVTAHADAAHVAWLTHPEHSYWAWSDQIIAGVITGSKYYPRGVTAVLWLEE